MLNGTFYGPRDPGSGVSTVDAAKSPTETAGTWQIVDVPGSGRDERIVIGAFGADLQKNTQTADFGDAETADFPNIVPKP